MADEATTPEVEEDSGFSLGDWFPQLVEGATSIYKSYSAEEVAKDNLEAAELLAQVQQDSNVNATTNDVSTTSNPVAANPAPLISGVNNTTLMIVGGVAVMGLVVFLVVK